MAQASQGIDEVNENVAQSSTFASEIAKDIGEVNRIAATLAENSREVSSNAGDLSRLAVDLRMMIGEFKVDRSPSEDTVPLTRGALITWDNSFILGIDTIDQQHRGLVDLVNTLHNAMRNRAGKQVLDRIFSELTEYTVNHFSVEESMMRESGHQQYEMHKKVHEEWTRRVEEYKQQFEIGSATVTMDLMTFLGDWLVDHVKGIDRNIVDSIKGK